MNPPNIWELPGLAFNWAVAALYRWSFALWRWTARRRVTETGIERHWREEVERTTPPFFKHFHIEIDPNMPRDTIELRQHGQVAAKIINIGTEDA